MRPAVATPLLLGVLFACGCSSAPDAQTQSAYAAFDAARAVQAQRYAPAVWQAAEDTLGLAIAEVEAQRARHVLARRYGQARRLFSRARLLAQRASADADAAMAAQRERLRQDVERMRGAAESAVAAATTAVESAPSTRRTQQALEIYRSDLVALTTTLQEAQGEYAAGNYQSALARLEYVARSAGGIPQKVAAALPAGPR